MPKLLVTAKSSGAACATMGISASQLSTLYGLKKGQRNFYTDNKAYSVRITYLSRFPSAEKFLLRLIEEPKSCVST